MSNRRRAKRRRGTDRSAAGIRLSVCMIVKNEADCLADCLQSLRGLADEVVVLDTGSTDATPDIARQYGARVLTRPWPGDFSTARNVSLQSARGEWMLVIDADETIARRDHAAIRVLLDAPADVMGYLLIQRNYTADNTTARWQATEPGCPEACGAPGWFPSPITRLFRRDARIRFAGEVHEAVDNAITTAGGRVIETTIPIHHYGKLRDGARMAAKADMYRELGEAKAARTGTAVAHYELGLQYAELGVLDKAEAELRDAVTIDPSLVKGWADLGSVVERGGRLAEAEDAYRRAHGLDPHYLPALVNLGAVLGKLQRNDEAKRAFDAARALNPDNPVILNNLAAHYAQGDDTGAAEELYRRSTAINPDYIQAHVNLANLLERGGRYPEALEILTAACERFPDHAPAHSARALLHVRRSEWAEAVSAGERAVALHDGDAVVWTNLGVAHYQLSQVDAALQATYRATRVDAAYEPAARNWAQLSAQYPDVAVRVTGGETPTGRIDVQTGPEFAFLHHGMPFTGATLRERGLGGTETAVVRMAEALTRRGCRVTVFNGCDMPAQVHGVGYVPLAACKEALADRAPTACIAARSWQALELAPTSVQRVYWAQDAPDQPTVQGLAHPKARACIDRYLGISAWQIAQYVEAFGMTDYLWMETRNGIDPALFATPAPTRDRHKLLYTSTPFRGLDVLLQLFPRIRAAVPDATLDLYTSMSVYGVSAVADREQYGALYDQAAQPGVRLLGSVPQAELATALQAAAILAYPNHFAETSCIAALEAQAAGCPVVTSALGALPETVAHAETGWCIPGHPHSTEYQDTFVDTVVALLRDDAQWRQFSERGRERVLGHYAWDTIAGEWLDQFAAVRV